MGGVGQRFGRATRDDASLAGFVLRLWQPGCILYSAAICIGADLERLPVHAIILFLRCLI